MIKDGKEGREAFPKIGPSQVIPEGICQCQSNLIPNLCPDINMAGSGSQRCKHPAKKMGPRHQLATEKQIKMVLVMCRY